MLRRVSEVPFEPRACKEQFTARDIRAFLGSNMDCAELLYEGRSADAIANSAQRYRAKHGLRDSFAICKRKGHVYLVRKEGR